MKTVNVVEVDSKGLINSLVSFPDNAEGNESAEQLFLDKLEGFGVSELDRYAATEDGYMEVKGMTFQLVHSSEWVRGESS